jgi:hypothetical protein
MHRLLSALLLAIAGVPAFAQAKKEPVTLRASAHFMSAAD